MGIRTFGKSNGFAIQISIVENLTHSHYPFQTYARDIMFLYTRNNYILHYSSSIFSCFNNWDVFISRLLIISHSCVNSSVELIVLMGYRSHLGDPGMIFKLIDHSIWEHYKTINVVIDKILVYFHIDNGVAIFVY